MAKLSQPRPSLHSSKLIDGHPDIVRRLESLGSAYVSTCVIVRGELRFMVDRSEWREANRAKLRNLLRDMDVHNVDQEAADVYGEIKAAIFGRFRAQGPAASQEGQTGGTWFYRE